MESHVVTKFDAGNWTSNYHIPLSKLSRLMGSSTISPLTWKESCARLLEFAYSLTYVYLGVAIWPDDKENRVSYLSVRSIQFHCKASRQLYKRRIRRVTHW